MSRPPNEILWSCLASPEPPELGQGPRTQIQPLAVLQDDLSLFFKNHSIEPGRAHRLRAAALLYHDHHDEAHDLVQDLPDAEPDATAPAPDSTPQVVQLDAFRRRTPPKS